VTGVSITTPGDGAKHSLKERGYKADKQIYQVCFICAKYNLQGVANSNGVAVGVDNTLLQWLSPGDTITLLTEDLTTVVYQDASGSAAVLTLAIQLPVIYTLPPANKV
jgi:hypothetical protein